MDFLRHQFGNGFWNHDFSSLGRESHPEGRVKMRLFIQSALKYKKRFAKPNEISFNPSEFSLPTPLRGPGAGGPGL